MAGTARVGTPVVDVATSPFSSSSPPAPPCGASVAASSYSSSEGGTQLDVPPRWGVCSPNTCIGRLPYMSSATG